MTEIEVEYNEKKLSHTDLTEQERLSIEAEYYEARLKQKEAVDKRTIEEAFQKAKLALQKQYNIETADENMNVLQQWNDDILDFLASETGQAVAGTMETVASSMSAVFQQLTSIVHHRTCTSRQLHRQGTVLSAEGCGGGPHHGRRRSIIRSVR